MKIIVVAAIFALYIGLTGCKNEKYNKVALQPSKELVNIGIGKNSVNLSFCLNYFESGGIRFLALNNERKNLIEVYNLDTREIARVINVKIEGPGSFPRMVGFMMESLDSIIAVDPVGKKVGVLDSEGYLKKEIYYGIDSKGKIIESTSPYGGGRPYVFNHKLVLCQGVNVSNANSILTQSIRDTSYIEAEIDFHKNICTSSLLKYPEELIGEKMLGQKICRAKGSNDCVLYHFGVSNGLFFSRDRMDYTKVPLETNYDLKLFKGQEYADDMRKALDYKLSFDEVQNIYYDSYRDYYYLVVRMRKAMSSKNIDYRLEFVYPDCLIIILDKDFRHMGEIILPDDTYSCQMIFVGPEGLYISEDHPNNPEFNEDFMRFRLFKLVKL